MDEMTTRRSQQQSSIKKLVFPQKRLVLDEQGNLIKNSDGQYEEEIETEYALVFYPDGRVEWDYFFDGEIEWRPEKSMG